MAPRNPTLNLSRPVLLRPFTSVSTIEQSSKTPEFEHLVPHEADSEFIQLNEAKWSETRFVHIFLDGNQLAPADTWEGAAQRWLSGSSEPNPLVLVVKVAPDGTQSVATGLVYRVATERGSLPDFERISELESVSIEPDELSQTGAYAVATPVGLPLPAIRALEQKRPQGVPPLGKGAALGISGPAHGQTPSNARWVFPVVDPLLIASSLAKKYSEACDAVLAASQSFERPAAASEEQQRTRNQGELQRLKKVVADNLVALKKAAPALASKFDSLLDAGFPDTFLKAHEEFLSTLSDEREIAAYHLIAWLETEVFATADDWWARNDDKPAKDYDKYVSSVLEALPRLIESSRGLAYLSDLTRRHDTGSSPVPSGVLHVVSEFVLRSTQSSDETRTIAIKTGTSLFGAWSAFLAASLALKQRLVKGPNPNTTFIEDLELLTKKLSLVFHDGVLTIERSSVPLELPAPKGVKTSVVSIPVPTISPLKQGLAATQLPSTYVGRVCAIINFGIAFTSLRNALSENGNARAKEMAISDLAGAGFGVVDQAVALPALESFRNRVAGKINMGGALLGNRAAGTLGLLGAVASLVSASLATVEELDRGDWDESLAHLTEGFGATLTGAGFAIILVSGTTGPFALWTIGIGTAISTAGFLWSIFAADTEIDQMLKFSAFGTQKGQAATSPPGWSQCKTTFAEWNPETRDGLLRQLEAFQQVFYSFEASGAENSALRSFASDCILRLFPSSLRSNCTFIIDYTAKYVSEGGLSEPVAKSGRARVHVSANAAAFVDEGNNFQSPIPSQFVKADGRDAIDVLFRLQNPLSDRAGVPMVPDSFTCQIQLQVPGAKFVDSGKEDVLVVPTTAGGARKLAARPQRNRKPAEERALSLTVA